MRGTGAGELTRHAAVLRVEVAEGLRAIVREPTALFFSVLFPVMFFAIFTSLLGTAAGPGGMPLAHAMLATFGTFGTFGAVSVMLMNPGITVADERTRGWLRVKKVSAMPVGTVVAAKVVAALPYALGVILALTAVATAVTGTLPPVGPWLRLVGVLVLGSLPSALLGLAVGFVTSSNATAAVLNAVFFPMVVASGLWFPLEVLPGFVQAVAPFLPTYHVAQAALAQLTGGPVAPHVLALLATTALAAGLAALAYRNLRV